MSDNRDQWDSSHPGLTGLQQAVEPLRREVVDHAIYSELNSVERVRIFLNRHVFAIWDFMSLLKSLQRDLIEVDVPWLPSGSKAGDGYADHFELYLDGMRQAGADARPITDFLALLRDGVAVPEALKGAQAPLAAADFTATTWEIIQTAPLHCRAAAVAFGREDLIQEMFRQLLDIDDPEGTLAVFKGHLAQYLEADSARHTPMARRLLVELCGEDEGKWAACTEVVRTSLRARVRLWTGIQAAFTVHPLSL